MLHARNYKKEHELDGKTEAVWFLFGILAWLPLALLCAWVRVRIWGWFVVPYLHAPMLTVLQMLGIGLFVSCFRRMQFPDKGKPVPERLAELFLEILGLFLEFSTAYVLHLYLTK